MSLAFLTTSKRVSQLQADEQGVLLFGVFGVQLSMQGSSALTLGLPPPGQLTLLSTELLGRISTRLYNLCNKFVFCTSP